MNKKNDTPTSVDYESLFMLVKDKNIAFEIYDLFILDSKRCLKDLNNYLKKANKKEWLVTLHQLKGMALNIRAMKLANTCVAAETSGIAEEVLLKNITIQLDKTIQDIKAIRRQYS